MIITKSSSADGGCGLCGCLALILFFMLPLMLLGRLFGVRGQMPRFRRRPQWEKEPGPPPEPPPPSQDIIDVEAKEIPPDYRQLGDR